MAFGKLASEFIDEYADKYVVFDASYQMHKEGGRIFTAGTIYTGLMIVNLYDGKILQVVWSPKDRELGRPFTELRIEIFPICWKAWQAKVHQVLGSLHVRETCRL